MVTLHSDVFIWIGSLSKESDFLFVLTKIHSKISPNCNIHFIHEHYEPLVFTELFSDWKNRSKLFNLSIVSTRQDMFQDLSIPMEQIDESEEKSDVETPPSSHSSQSGMG